MDENKIKLKQTIAVFCVIFAVMILIALISNLVKLAALNARERELTEKIAQLDIQLTQMEQAISMRETNEYIDQFVREWLFMHGKDEVTYIGK